MILITLTCIYHATALSFDFVATEQPSGIQHFGDSRVQTVCDPTRECSRLGIRSRNQCQRMNCCWVSNKCVAKTYFILDSYSGIYIGNCKYRFTKVGDWYHSREECKSYGGDLIHKQFGPTGAAYHDKLREFITSKIDTHNIWVGYTDLDTEGEWKLVNGELYDADDKNLESLYHWKSGQPNNYQGREDCANIYRVNPGDDVALGDNWCTQSGHDQFIYRGLCEIC